MERKKKKEKSGFYVAICCCVVIIAIVGYANRISLKEDSGEDFVQQSKAIEEPATTNAPIQIEEFPKSEPKTAEITQVDENKQVTVSKNVQVEEELQFNLPVDGKVIEEFSGDDLVYNEALKDWRAHSGVDFDAEIGEQVVCSAKGIVEDVFDSSLGRCVIVDHKNGFKTMYANLNEETKVSVGDELVQGDVIGTVGNTALGDSTDEPHLHFEMMKQNKNVNPVEYLE